jgi:acyl-coenzyme A thioesterase PaaI-like protein
MKTPAPNSNIAIIIVVSEQSSSPRSTPLAGLREHLHPDCFACGTGRNPSLQLRCHVQDDGSVSATFEPAIWMQGYADRMQGGLVTTLLDSAMTQCLFACGIEAVTATLEMRFREPAPLIGQYLVTAVLHSDRHGIYEVHSELRHAGRRIATGVGLFVRRRPDTPDVS